MDSSNYLIDTHCHLTDLSKVELEKILKNANENGVKKFISIGASNGLDPNFKSIELANNYESIYATIGIHPHDAGKVHWNDELLELINNPKVVAIGETGLDFYKEWSDFGEQEKLFEKTIEIANKHNKNLVIHCRDAHQRTMEILNSSSKAQSVFHCFGDTLENAKKILDSGNLISLTGIITFKNANSLRDCIAYIPLDRIMLETDSPYMAPEPFRGQKSEPAHVKIIAEHLAKIHNVSIEEVIKKTTKNAKDFFSI